MQTQLFNMKEKIEDDALHKVVQLLRKGEVVAFPTETVYGLGADATNEVAVEKIFKTKGRPSDNPLIVHVATKEQLLELAIDVHSYVEKLIDTFSPGPITYVLNSANRVAPIVTANLTTVGIRIPNHPVALAILQASNLPLAAPSANRSGKPSPTSATHVMEDLFSKIPAIVDGGNTNIGLESTVVDCTGHIPLILRPGSITANEIAAVVGECHVYEQAQVATKPLSPGLKYVHYAPAIPLLLVDSNRIAEIIHSKNKLGKRIALLYNTEAFHRINTTEKIHITNDEAKLGKQLYGLLRLFTKESVDLIVFERPAFPKGSAVIDRLQRAATKIIT